MNKNIFITGGSGYIGRNLQEYLAGTGKYTVLAPTHEELELTDTYAVENYFKTHPVDVVIHCAVVGGSRKEEQVKDSVNHNLRMFFNVIRCQKHYKKMIHLGSGAEYGRSKSLVKVKESDFERKVPRNDYGFFKYICSKYIAIIERVVNLRIFGLYGKYEDYRLRFISNAICRNIMGLPIVLRQNVFFDYVYINDFVKIVEYFINNHPRYKFYNIGRGERIDLITIAEKINAISDKKSQIVIKNSGLNKEYTCDNSRLLREISNLTFTDFDQSLRELFVWYKKKRVDIDKSSL